jgi:hypothetical protein
MKLVNYQLQTQIESLSKDKPLEKFIEYISAIIEDTSKPYFQRADYVGLSLQELKSKIDVLSQDISELQALKKRLTESLELAKEATAHVCINNGIDRIDGNIISSLTITKESKKVKESIQILDNNAVMELGFIRYEPDMKAIEKALKTDMGKKELEPYISITATETVIPPKIKVNTKRRNSKAKPEETEEIVSIVEPTSIGGTDTDKNLLPNGVNKQTQIQVA